MLPKVYFHHPLSVLSEKSDHHPWMKFIWIRHGRGRMESCTFLPPPRDEAKANGKELLLTILFVIGVYLLWNLLGWRGIGEVSQSKHNFEINLSMHLLVMSEGLFSQQSWLLCGKDMSSCFLFCWVLDVTANLWYSFSPKYEKYSSLNLSSINFTMLVSTLNWILVEETKLLELLEIIPNACN